MRSSMRSAPREARTPPARGARAPVGALERRRRELEDLGASRIIPESGGELPFPAPLRTITQAAVERMLRLAHGNKSEAARRLGISRPRLQRIIDGLGEDE